MQNKVLVIGSNGFVGFNLVKELIEHNYEVYCGISSHNSAYRVCTIKSKKVVLPAPDSPTIPTHEFFLISKLISERNINEKSLNSLLDKEIWEYLHLKKIG